VGACCATAQPIKKLLTSSSDNPNNLPLYKKVAAGTLAGSLGSAIFNPTDLIKARRPRCR
jgi:hypothetical protein